MINQVVSHYRILEELGKGAMGVVYLADDLHLVRQVAVKFAHEKHDEFRFQREARLAASLKHKNIATIYDFGKTEDGHQFIVMELICGPKLSEHLRRRELTLERRLEIVAEIAEALGKAHGHGIVHRDIKPGNVIINEHGEVKVLDFGLARHFQTPPSDSSDSIDLFAQTLTNPQTQDGVMLGTPYYMSPEQACGRPQEADARSDLFSLGVILYQCLTDELPFTGATPVEVYAKILHIEPPPPSQHNTQTTPELDRITIKALAKNPGERYQSADEMLADLKGAIAGLSQSDGVAAQPAQQPNPPKIADKTDGREVPDKQRKLFRWVAIMVLMGIGYLALSRATHWWPFQFKLHRPSSEAARWYREGTDALHDGTYFLAKQKLDRALNIDKQYPLARARLAETLAELDNSYDAHQELLNVSELVPDRSQWPELERLSLQAITNIVSRKFTEAIADYQKILQLSSSEGKASACLDLGRAYEKNDDVDQAIKQYQQAIGFNPRSAAAHLRLGILHGRKKDVTAAQAAFSEAERFYQGVNVEGQASVSYWRGFTFDSLGQFPQARLELNQALKKSQALDNQYLEILAHFQLSGVAADEGQFAEAQSEAEKAIKLAQDNQLEQLIGRGLLHLGYAFFRQTQYKQAEQYFIRARDVASQYKAQYLQALIELNLGGLHIRLGQKDQGLQEVEHALSFLRSRGYPREAAEGMRYIIRDKRDRGDVIAAQALCDQMLSLAEKWNDPGLKAAGQYELGRVLFYQGRYLEAVKIFEEVTGYYDRTAEPDKAAFASINLASIWWRLGNYDEAKKARAGTEARIKKLKGGIPRVSEMIGLLDAEIALSQKNFSAALAKTKPLTESSSSDIATRSKFLACLAQVLSGTPSANINLCEKAVEEAGKSRDELLLAEARLALAQAKIESRDAQGAAEIAHQSRNAFEVLKHIEAEWRAMLAVARAKQIGGGNTQECSEAARRTEQKLKVLAEQWGTQVYGHYKDRPDIRHKLDQLNQMLVTQ